MPRYQAAVGQPGAAFVAITDWLEATASNEYELWGNPSEGLYVTAAELAADPLPAGSDIEAPDALAIVDPEIRLDAMIVAARLLAASGETSRADALFRRAAGDMGDAVDRTRVFAMWAAAGFALPAAEAAAGLEPESGTRARLAIAEGLAFTGNVAATEAAVANLQDWLAARGDMALAEAYRRAGQADRARASLDRAGAALQADGKAAPEAWRRLAQGYALLGETQAARQAMLIDANGRDLREGLAWRDIAPMVACHDLPFALGLLDQGGGERDPTAVVDVLVAAAASGDGQNAHIFASGQTDSFKRVLYLLATVIGLRHAKLADDPALPCATVSVIGG
jgi:hypothetical protein